MKLTDIYMAALKNTKIGTSLVVQVKNLPSSAGDMGSIPGLGTNTPHTAGLLSPPVRTREFLAPQ